MAKSSIDYTFGPNGEKRSFKSEEDLGKFLNSTDFLEWVSNFSGTTENLVNWLHRFKQETLQEVRYILQNHGFQNAPYHVELLMKNRPFPTGRTPLAKWLVKLSKEAPDKAIYAFFAVLGQSPTAFSYEHASGAALVEIFKQGITPENSEITKQNLDDLVVNFEGLIQEAKENEENRQKEMRNELDTIKKAHAKMIETNEERSLGIRLALENKVAKLVVDTKEQAIEAIEKINNTDKAFTERMALEASVNYWEKKASRHRKTLKVGLLSLEVRVAAYFVVSGILAAIYVVKVVLPSVSPGNPSSTVVYASLGLFISSLILWYGRLLTRQLINQRHLYEDAEERRVMMMSYIALTKEGHVDKEDRVLALGSAFRPATSGVNGDDASPDISTAAIIGRLVQNK